MDQLSRKLKFGLLCLSTASLTGGLFCVRSRRMAEMIRPKVRVRSAAFMQLEDGSRMLLSFALP